MCLVEGVVGEVKSVSWGGAQTKGEVHKRELVLLNSDFLTSVSSSLTQLFLRLKNSRWELMGYKYRVLLTNHIVLYTRLTHVKRYQNILEHFCTKM